MPELELQGWPGGILPPPQMWGKVWDGALGRGGTYPDPLSRGSLPVVEAGLGALQEEP